MAETPSRERTTQRAAEERERGSVLMLFPAGMLVVLLLGAIAVDAAVLHLRQRELVAAAQAAAQDAATYGLDQDALRRGDWRLSPTRTDAAVAATLAASDVDGLLTAPPQVRIAGATVTVVLHGEAEAVFGVVAGGDDTAISARASATAPRR